MNDPVPPTHGEPEPRSDGRGSDVYTDAEWDAAQRERVAIRHSFDAPTIWGGEDF